MLCYYYTYSVITMYSVYGKINVMMTMMTVRNNGCKTHGRLRATKHNDHVARVSQRCTTKMLTASC